jgi:hypothetical protein
LLQAPAPDDEAISAFLTSPNTLHGLVAAIPTDCRQGVRESLVESINRFPEWARVTLVTPFANLLQEQMELGDDGTVLTEYFFLSFILFLF